MYQENLLQIMTHYYITNFLNSGYCMIFVNMIKGTEHSLYLKIIPARFLIL